MQKWKKNVCLYCIINRFMSVEMNAKLLNLDKFSCFKKKFGKFMQGKFFNSFSEVLLVFSSSSVTDWRVFKWGGGGFIEIHQIIQFLLKGKSEEKILIDLWIIRSLLKVENFFFFSSLWKFSFFPHFPQFFLHFFLSSWEFN